MKKILSLALAVILAFCIVPALPVDVSAAVGLSMIDGADILDDAQVENFGYVTLGKDTNTLEIPIKPEGFGDWVTHEDIDTYTMSNMTVVFTDDATGRLFKVSKKEYEKDYNARITLTAQNIGGATGEIYVLYSYGTSVVKSKPIRISGRYIDPTINKNIVGIKDLPLDNEDTTVVREKTEIKLDGKVIDADALQDLTVVPGSEITFRLHTDYFIWDPDITDMATSVRKASLENDMISLSKKISKGSDVIDEIVLENIAGEGHVVVRFVEDLNYTKERDFSMDIALAQRNVRNDETKVLILGSISNDVVYVDGDDYVYLGDGAVAEALSFSKNVQLDLGYGVSVFMNLFEDKKYYGKATDSRTRTDDEIADYYPAIRKILNLKVTNIGGSGNIVELKDLDQEYYVYDEDGALLGMSNERLPFRKKYFLADSRIEFGTDFAGQPNDDDDDDLVEVAVANSTDNPMTGGGGLSLAPMHLVGMALMLAGAVSGKAAKRGRQ